MSAVVEDAARLGSRAGAAFRSTGIPSPNPFTGDRKNLEVLAAAWRRAYLAALARGRG